jgi:hypothetical protein
MAFPTNAMLPATVNLETVDAYKCMLDGYALI